MKLKCSVPLCEKCANYDWERTSEIKDAFRGAGIDEPKSIWCKSTNRPEDMCYERCQDFARCTWV